MSEQPMDRRRMKKMGLARQLWLLLVIPISLVLGAYGLLAQGVRQRVLSSEASAELRDHATLVEAALGGAVERGEVQRLKQRIEWMARADRIMGIAAFDSRGEAILITDHVAAAAPALASIARRAADLGDDLEEEHELAGTKALVRTVTFSPKNQDRAVVAVVVRDLRYLSTLRATLDRGLVLAGAIVLLLTAVIGGVVTRITVGRPVRAIVQGATRVASGELDAHVPETGAEELARLARAFNAMTSSLHDARARGQRDELERAAIERKLQHAQALAAVGQVAASIAHEIGSPLNVILGRAQRAADQPGCPAELRGELETIAGQSERISRVVARLLAVARPPQATGRRSNLVQVIQETLAFLGPECKQRGVRARFDAGGAAPHVALDGDQMFQIVFNLCLNAIQSQSGGGDLLVRLVTPGKRGEGARGVAFEVADSGPGVPPSFREHIFEPFFTSKGAQGGTGLGLAIVAGILREAGGSIELLATEGGGARFRVTLPAAGPPAPRGGTEARA
jgi:signal transduction histidine kinase